MPSKKGFQRELYFAILKNKDAILAATIDHYGQFDDVIMAICRQQDLTGLEVIRDFENKCKVSVNNRVKIVMISVLTDHASVNRARDLGVHGYLGKPLEIEKLTKKWTN